MDALTDKYLKIAGTRDYLAPNSLNTDPLDQKLLTCWQSLTGDGVVESICERRLVSVGERQSQKVNRSLRTARPLSGHKLCC